MPAATKKNASANANAYDPTQEPVGELGSSDATSLTAEANKARGVGSVIEPGKVIEITEPAWMALLRDVAASTPSKYPPTHSVAQRVADTGRVLTISQSVALQRVIDYVRERNPKIDSRGYGMIPAHKPAHASILMVEIIAAILEDLDAQGAALSESSGASGAEA